MYMYRSIYIHIYVKQQLIHQLIDSYAYDSIEHHSGHPVPGFWDLQRRFLSMGVVWSNIHTLTLVRYRYVYVFIHMRVGHVLVIMGMKNERSQMVTNSKLTSWAPGPGPWVSFRARGPRQWVQGPARDYGPGARGDDSWDCDLARVNFLFDVPQSHIYVYLYAYRFVVMFE